MAVVQRVEVDERSLAALLTALEAEGNADKLKRELARRLHEVVQPAAEAAKSAIGSMTARTVAVPALRTAVAAGVEVSVRLAGTASVAVIAHKSGMPRGFKNAPKRLQSRKGWRHQVYGNPNRWVTQMGKPGWFDDTLAATRPEAERAARKVLDDMADHISARTRG